MSDWDGATRLTAAVTLAVPINPVHLIAHLEAHMATRQALHALKLCHRFGRGLSGSTRSTKRLNGGLEKLQELPLELICLIESYVLLPLRASLIKEYEVMFRCFAQTCKVRDHYSDEECEEFEAAAYDITLLRDGRFADYEWDSAEFESGPMRKRFDDAVEERLMDLMLEGDYYQAHADRTDEWQTKILTHRHESKPDTVCDPSIFGFCSLERELMRAFGLNSLLHTQPIPYYLWNLFDESTVPEGMERYCTTIGYLHLPVDAAGHDASALNESFDYESTVGQLSACLSTIVDIDKLITMKSKTPQLQFALKRLGLKPFVHWSAAALQTSSTGSLSTHIERAKFRHDEVSNMTEQQKQELKMSIEKITSEKAELFRTKGPQFMLLAAGSSGCGHVF